MDEQLAAMEARLEAWYQQRVNKTNQVVERWAAKSKTFMQVNAVWKDQTGEARRTMDAVVTRGATRRDGTKVTLMYKVPYGRTLATTSGGVYDIIGPTIAIMGPELMSEIQDVWK